MGAGGNAESVIDGPLTREQQLRLMRAAEELRKSGQCTWPSKLPSPSEYLVSEAGIFFAMLFAVISGLSDAKDLASWTVAFSVALLCLGSIANAVVKLCLRRMKRSRLLAAIQAADVAGRLAAFSINEEAQRSWLSTARSRHRREAALSADAQLLYRGLRLWPLLCPGREAWLKRSELDPIAKSKAGWLFWFITFAAAITACAWPLLHPLAPYACAVTLLALALSSMPSLLHSDRWIGAELLETMLALKAYPEDALKADAKSRVPKWQLHQVFSDAATAHTLVWIVGLVCPIVTGICIASGPLYDYAGAGFTDRELYGWVIGFGVIPALCTLAGGGFIIYLWHNRLLKVFDEAGVLQSLVWGGQGDEPAVHPAQMRQPRGSARGQTLVSELQRASRRILAIAPKARIDYLRRWGLLWLVPLIAVLSGVAGLRSQMDSVWYAPPPQEIALWLFLPHLGPLAVPLLAAPVARRYAFLEYARIAAGRPG